MPASREALYLKKHGMLPVSVEPVDEKQIYFTRDTPEFDLVIKNNTEKRIISRRNDGICWVLGVGHSKPEAAHWEKINIEIEPGGEQRERIGGEFLAFEGNGAIGVTSASIPGGVDNDDVILEAVPPDRSASNWLYTFRVWDKSHYETLHEQPKKLLKRSLYLTAGVLLLAGVTAASAILQLLLALG